MIISFARNTDAPSKAEVQEIVSSALTPYSTTEEMDAAITGAVSGKTDQTYTEDIEQAAAGILNLKANQSYVDEQIGGVADALSNI